MNQKELESRIDDINKALGLETYGEKSFYLDVMRSGGNDAKAYKICRIAPVTGNPIELTRRRLTGSEAESFLAGVVAALETEEIVKYV